MTVFVIMLIQSINKLKKVDLNEKKTKKQVK